MKHIVLIVALVCFLPATCLAQRFNFATLTSEGGLSHNSVFSIAQDYKGFVWFGTRDGVSRYDSQRIKNYSLNAYSPTVEANRVNCLYTVGRELWVGTPVGLFRYRSDKDDFVQVDLGAGPVSVSEISRVSTGELWIGSRDGIYILGKQGQKRHILSKQNIHAICEFRKGSFLILQDDRPRVINAEGETLVVLPVYGAEYEKTSSFRNYKLLKDHRGAIWISTELNLFQLDEKLMAFKPVDWFSRLVKGRVSIIRTVTEDQAGNVWFGGESGAIVVDKQRQTTQLYDKSFTASPYGLTDRAVYSSYASRDGTVWLGTYFGGVNYTKPVGRSFDHLFSATTGQTIAGKAISQLAVDDKKRIWIGTEDGGVSIRDPTTGQYTYYNRQNGLSDHNVHGIWLEKPGVAWVGTFIGGLNRIDADRSGASAIRVFKHDPTDSTSISDNSIYAIHRDRANTLWVGTPKGVNLFDDKTETFRLFKPDVLGNTFIYDIAEDTFGLIWIATLRSGIYRYDPKSDALTHYAMENTPTLRTNQIISIYEDSAHNIWFGTLNGGVYRWDHALGRFTPNPVNANLPNQTVYSVLEDNRGTYWFSTNRGLLSFNPRQNTYRVFDDSNGLQATQFNFRSSLKDGRGNLYFGSVEGLCYFDPDVITQRVFDPPVYFTDLKLFNKAVKADGESVLTKHLDETDELTFAHSQNVITLDFVAINYFSKRTNYYIYYLEGFEEAWNPKTTINSRTYTNLSPGTYTFHVRSYQSNGQLSPTERTIRLIIKPPFWQTSWAYLFYGLAGMGMLLVYRRFITFLNGQKVAVQLARVEREKSEELNQQKLNFFTFLSNEFKTPITLIMAEIDELIQSNQAWRADSATNYSAIKRNAKRLQSLIDQITELRKTGSDLQKIYLTESDIIAFIKETVRGFDPLLQSRRIRKRTSFSHPYLMASFDAGKLEMIVSNVFFFLTNELADGDELALNVQIEPVPGQPDCQLTIMFSLGGHPELFETIEVTHQLADDNEELFRQNKPSSVGLLLTFSLVKLLSGAVLFSGEGTRNDLSLRIPIRRSPVSKTPLGQKKTEQLSTHLVRISDDLPPENEFPCSVADEVSSADKPTILIIDRSDDLIQFLKRHYQENYRIRVAYTFSESIRKAENILPEIILCDNDIRNKENQNLCVALKNNPVTQAIPVILLLNDEDDFTILGGLNSGADGYISKPFNLRELDLMIGNQLKSVSMLKNKLVGGFADSLLAALPRRNKDQEFMIRFSTLINQEYKNKDLTADSLAQLMHCSRSQLHTKLKTLTGLSTKEYLIDHRLALGRQLLENGMSVSEAAFEVGFSDPNYFGRAFKKRFGITPSGLLT